MSEFQVIWNFMINEYKMNVFSTKSFGDTVFFSNNSWFFINLFFSNSFEHVDNLISLYNYNDIFYNFIFKFNSLK